MKPSLIIWPTGLVGEHGRPTVAIETTCDHATLTTEYEAATPALTVEERGRLIGSASKLHDEEVGRHRRSNGRRPCDCFRNGARVRVGMPEEWQREGIGPEHRRWVDA